MYCDVLWSFIQRLKMLTLTFKIILYDHEPLLKSYLTREEV